MVEFWLALHSAGRPTDECPRVLERPTRTECSGMQGRPKRLQNVGATDAIAMEAPCVVKWLALGTVGQELAPQFAEQLHVEPWGGQARKMCWMTGAKEKPDVAGGVTFSTAAPTRERLEVDRPATQVHVVSA